MVSWRDTASPEAQSDLDSLLNAALPFAQQMLAEHGEFYPFAITLSGSGEQGVVAGDTVGSEHPSCDEVLSLSLRVCKHNVMTCGQRLSSQM